MKNISHCRKITTRLAPKLVISIAISSGLLLSACGGGGSSDPSAVEPEIQQQTEQKPAAIAHAVEKFELGDNAPTERSRGCDSYANSGPISIATLQESHLVRANTNAKYLAMEASGQVIAPETLYQRIDAELTGLRSAFRAETNHDAQPCYTNRILVWFNNEIADLTEYSDYNTALLATEGVSNLNGGAVILHFDSTLDMRWVANEYSKLHGIEQAEPDSFATDGNDICLEVLDDDRHLYIFDNAGGDCTSGCFGHQYHGFTVDADGNTLSLGSYATGSLQTNPGQEQPQWWANAKQCRNFL